MGAAERLLESLQDHVPFTFLGKFAAYAVGVTRGDIEGLDAAARAATGAATGAAAGSGAGREAGREAGAEGGAGPLPSLVLMARSQMDRFRHGNYELFSKLYPVPPEHNSLDSLEWFDHLPGGVRGGRGGGWGGASDAARPYLPQRHLHARPVQPAHTRPVPACYGSAAVEQQTQGGGSVLSRPDCAPSAVTNHAVPPLRRW